MPDGTPLYAYDSVSLGSSMMVPERFSAIILGRKEVINKDLRCMGLQVKEGDYHPELLGFDGMGNITVRWQIEQLPQIV